MAAERAIPFGLTRDHILAAIDDYDRGIPHSFGNAKKYALIHEGKSYPPKAIVGLAVRHLTGRALTPGEFSSGAGAGQAVDELRRLNFEVVQGPNRSAYLMTWNPEVWNDWDYDQIVANNSRGERLVYNWSTGNRKDIAKGSRVYLVRQSSHRGIIASGHTTANVESGPHFSQEGREAHYVDIEWDTLLSPINVLPIAELTRQFPDFTWNRLQSSGIAVPEQDVESLDELWQAHLNKIGRSHLFKVGNQYTRKDIYKVLKVPAENQGGDWDTGYHKHGDDWFIFCAIGASGRTGHDYGNYWDGDELIWRGKTNSQLSHATIQSLLSPTGQIYLFSRESDRSPFIFEGNARAREFQDTTPVTIRWHFPTAGERRLEILPNEVSQSQGLREGAVTQILVNAYERNPSARRKCLNHHGYICKACGFDFAKFYGPIGEEYIHVHHIRDLASIGQEYEVDPINDLVLSRFSVNRNFEGAEFVGKRRS